MGNNQPYIPIKRGKVMLIMCVNDIIITSDDKDIDDLKTFLQNSFQTKDRANFIISWVLR